MWFTKQLNGYNRYDSIYYRRRDYARLRILPLAEIRIQTEKTRLQQRLRQMRRLWLNEESSKSKGRLKPFQTAFCIFGLWLKQQEYRICRRMPVESMAFQTNPKRELQQPRQPI